MFLAVIGLCALAQVAASSGDVTLKYSSEIARVIQLWSSNVIPIPADEPGPLNVTITLSFVAILDVDKDRNQVDILIWQATSWQNKAMAWDANESGFNSINVPSFYIWHPDITIYNTITKPEVLSPEVAVVSDNGSVYFVESIRSGVTCELAAVDTEQGANCTIKLGSWTYNGATLTISDKSSADLHEYTPNPKYELVSTSHKNERRFYACCPGVPYEDFSFRFGIRSKGQRG